ncbi:response regulator transcription factor [Zoogloea sp.]|jgi:DNA-binding NarL/FixJ family response regulator|uniref:response regulator n=1 Tax=Zoogloea sp. TaxID=49181 RepID=UPI0035AF04EF
MSSAPASLNTVIVEDNPALLELLSGMLGGIERVEVVGTAASEAEAISMIRSTRPRLAIVDLELRAGTGLKVLGAIQRNAADFGAPRTVVFSNHAHPIVKSRCLALGAAAFFDKSFQMDELLEFVQALAESTA